MTMRNYTVPIPKHLVRTKDTSYSVRFELRKDKYIINGTEYPSKIGNCSKASHYTSHVLQENILITLFESTDIL